MICALLGEAKSKQRALKLRAQQVLDYVMMWREAAMWLKVYKRQMTLKSVMQANRPSLLPRAQNDNLAEVAEYLEQAEMESTAGLWR